ncbi:MAG TPA: hypothetical protein VIL12_04760, partial [Acidimicrobiia bacterium]
AWEKGAAKAAADAVPTDVALVFGVAGTPAECRDQLGAYSESGIEHMVVRPVPVGEGGLEPAARVASELL